MTDDTAFMQAAMDIAKEGAKKGNRYFGAVLVKDNRIVARAHNTVIGDTDPTAHAELNLIREFAREIHNADLSEYTLYATCEPCPMCTSAIAWANIKRVVFGTQRDDYKGTYRRQLTMWPDKFYQEESLDIEIINGILRKEIMQMYEKYN